MQTIDDFFTVDTPFTEQQLVTVTDTLAQHGSLQHVQDAVSDDLFNVYIAIHTFGNWAEGGWWTIVSEHAELIPYIPNMFEALQLPSLHEPFHQLIQLFPAGTLFSSESTAYVTLINFYENPRFQLNDAALQAVPKEKRQQLSREMHARIETLDAATETELAAYEEQWTPLYTYLKERL